MFLKIEFRIELNKKHLQITTNEISTIITCHFYYILLVTLNGYENVEKKMSKKENVKGKNIEKNVDHIKCRKFQDVHLHLHSDSSPSLSSPLYLCFALLKRIKYNFYFSNQVHHYSLFRHFYLQIFLLRRSGGARKKF